MENISSWIPQRLQRLCWERNLSQYELAKRSGVSSGTVSRILAGKVSPSIEVLHSLCLGLNITEEDFFHEKKHTVQSEYDKRILRALHALPRAHQEYHINYLEYAAQNYTSLYK